MELPVDSTSPTSSQNAWRLERPLSRGIELAQIHLLGQCVSELIHEEVRPRRGGESFVPALTILSYLKVANAFKLPSLDTDFSRRKLRATHEAVRQNFSEPVSGKITDITVRNYRWLHGTSQNKSLGVWLVLDLDPLISGATEADTALANATNVRPSRNIRHHLRVFNIRNYNIDQSAVRDATQSAIERMGLSSLTFSGVEIREYELIAQQ